jgi:hypothetical protein
MKQEKFDALVEEIEQWMADKYFKSFHRIFFEDIVEAFPDIKKKHLKKIWEDLQ